MGRVLAEVSVGLAAMGVVGLLILFLASLWKLLS